MPMISVEIAGDGQRDAHADARRQRGAVLGRLVRSEHAAHDAEVVVDRDGDEEGGETASM